MQKLYGLVLMVRRPIRSGDATKWLMLTTCVHKSATNYQPIRKDALPERRSLMFSNGQICESRVNYGLPQLLHFLIVTKKDFKYPSGTGNPKNITALTSCVRILIGFEGLVG